LLKNFAKERLRLRVYIPTAYSGLFPSNLGKICQKISCLRVRKAKHISYHIYVNSRPLLRRFKELKTNLKMISNDKIIPYLAGRFDGDGSVAGDFRRDLRIVYGNIKETALDKELLSRVRGYKTKIYRYKKANTYCLYVSRYDTKNFLQDILPFSRKMRNSLPRRD
jgi:intein/homing endonuclease